ncbi:MAG: DUF559 domain-containing protein [Methanophagales archaeon]|nr:DUF559 domain-containing protein [Methanophagales archaeon]
MVKVDIWKLPSEDQVFVRAKLKKLDDTTLSGYNVGDVIERNGGKYIIERSHFGRPGQLQIRELVPPAKMDTDLEKKTEQYLNELGFKEHEDYEHNPPYNVSKYWIDFAFVNEKVAVEPGADYWHPEERDKRKEKALNERGWEVLWFNEDDINQDKEGVKKRIYESIMRIREVGTGNDKK